MPIPLLVIFLLIVSLPMGMIINYLIYNKANNTGLKLYAMIGLLSLFYVTLILMDFDLDRYGDSFQNRIRGTQSTDTYVFGSIIAGVIIGSVIFHKNLKNKDK